MEIGLLLELVFRWVWKDRYLSIHLSLILVRGMN